jgi:type I restriction enzyme S subunit
MIKLTFKQTDSEMIVRAAASVLFGTLIRRGAKLVSISDLAERPQYGFTATAAIEPVGPKFVRITDLQDGKIDWNTVPFCECAEPGKYLLQDDDLLFARTGATTGKTHLVKDAERAVFASYLIRLRPKPGVFAGYLHAFFQSDAYWIQISDEKEGSAQPNVNGEKLAALQIPRVDLKLQHAIAEFLRCVRSRQDGEKVELPELLTPLAEQRRVVSRIEELAAQIQEARTLRRQAAEEAEALLLSKLGAVFSREVEQRGTTRLEGLLVDAGYGSSEKCNAERVEEATPVLRIPNVASERINLTDMKYARLNKRDSEKLLLSEGDVLVVRTNGSLELVGRSAVVPKLEEPFAFASYMIRLRFDRKRIAPDYAQRMMQYLRVAGVLVDFARTTAGQYNVSLGRLRAAEIPVPPLTEQRRIVAELDALQAEVDALKRLQAGTAVELDALLPAILDRAFKGEL